MTWDVGFERRELGGCLMSQSAVRIDAKNKWVIGHCDEDGACGKDGRWERWESVNIIIKCALYGARVAEGTWMRENE